MSGEVGTAYVRIRPNTAGFQSEATSSLARSVKGIAAAVGAAFAAQKVVQFGISSVETAASLQKSSEFVQQSFGKQSKALNDFADTAASKFLISKDASEQFSATIGRLAQQNGISAKTAAQMSIEMQKLAGSFGEVQGQDPTQFLEALSRALIGNTRGLKQLGIAVNSQNELQAAERLGFIQTTVDANKVAEAHARVAEYTAKVSEETKKYGANSTQTLGAVAELKGAQDQLSSALAGKATSTVTSLTAAQKAQVIMAVATSHLSELQQEAAKHSGDLADQQIRLSAEWSNAKAQIGDELLPQVTKLATVFAQNLPGAMDKFDQAMKTVIGDVSPAIPPLVSSFQFLFGVIRDNQQIFVDLVGGAIAVKLAYKGINEVIAIGRDVIGIYNGFLQKLGFGEAQTASETQVHTAAIEANTAALQAQTSAMAAGSAASVETAAMSSEAAASFAAQSDAAIAAGAAGEAYGRAVGQAALEVQALVGADAELVTVQAALTAGLAEATAAQAAYDAALAATEAETLVTESALAGLGEGLLAIAGGPIAIAALATVGIGFALYKLGQQATPLDAALSGLGGSFDNLAYQMTRASSARQDLKQSLSTTAEDKMAVAEAKLQVEQAKANLSNKNLNKTSLERKQNELQLKEAVQQLRSAQENLTEADKNTKKAEDNLANATKRRDDIIKNQLYPHIRDVIGQDIIAAQKTGELSGKLGAYATAGERAAAQQEAQRKAANQFAAQLDDLSQKYEKSNPVLAHNIGLIKDLTQKFHEVPSKKEVDFILHIRKPKETLSQVIEGFAHGDAPKLGEDISHAFGQGMDNGLRKYQPILHTHAKGLVNDMFNAMRDQGQISSPSLLFQNGIGVPIVQGIQAGIQQQDKPLQATFKNVLQDQMDPLQKETNDLGTSIYQGIVQPVANNLASRLGSAITSAANSAIAQAKAALKIHSPSMLFSEQVGQPIAEGILHGMGGLKQGLINQVNTAARSAISAAGGITPGGTAATGANQELGRRMMLQAGWGADQWGALQALWNRESGWNQFAKNPSSGAYGIPQSLPASKMASAGSDWLTNPATQIAWGLSYIRSRYGSPGGAWAHELSAGWYDEGGVIPGRFRGEPVVIGAHAGETVLPTHKDKTLGGVTIENLTVLSSSPHIWGSASDVMNAIARKVQR